MGQREGAAAADVHVRRARLERGAHSCEGFVKKMQ